MHHDQQPGGVTEIGSAKRDWSDPKWREGKPFPHEALHDFANRIIVAGTRGFDDYAMFCDVLQGRIPRYDGSIIFISGAASSGADALIIRFCKEFGYAWVEFPADWNGPHKKGAGFVRNVDMGDVGTDLITFWDARSPGTKHMIEVANDKKLHVVTVLIETQRHYGKPSKRS